MNMQPSTAFGLDSVQISSNAAYCAPNDNVMFILNGTNGNAPFLIYNGPSWDYTATNLGTPPYNVSNPGEIIGMENATGDRIWFHGSGFSDCMNDGYYSVSGDDTEPTSLQVTNNTAAC
jgi:hypothetical protein